MVAGDNEHDEHDRLVFTLGPSSACPWTLERAPSGNGQPAVELAPVDDVQGEGAGLHRILSQSVSTAQGGHIAGKSLGLVSIVPRTVSVPSAKRKARDAPTHKAAPRGPAHSTARKSTPQTPPVAPVAQMHHGLPTRLSDLKTPVAQLQLRGFPCAPAQQSTAAGSRKQLAKPALPSIPTPDRRRSGALLGIPTEPTGMALAFPGQPGRREKIIPLKSPAPTPATAGLLHGLCTPAHHSRPPLYLAACSSRAQQPVAPAHTPALVQPQAPTQYKSPMTMADLGLPARTGPARQMSAPHSTNYKHAIIPLLASPMRPGPEAAAVSPEAKPSRAQLLANVPKQEGASSLFSPKLKKQKSKVTGMLQRLEDAQASLTQARLEAMALSAAGLQQGSQLQDAANAEILKEESRAYVIVDRDEKNEWWKVANVGDRFVVLQPWNILAQYHEEPVMLAFVAVPFPNE